MIIEKATGDSGNWIAVTGKWFVGASARTANPLTLVIILRIEF